MKKIVLVVGAGASHELDFPTGYDLINRIIENIDFNHNYSFGNGEGQFLDMVNQFLNAIGKKSETQEENEQNKIFFQTTLLPIKEELRVWANENKSLDAFLNRDGNDILVKEFGKFAIAYYIIGQEEWLIRENLYAFRSNWLREFIERHLQPAKAKFCSGEMKVRIITFNYDRIIEHFLYNFLRHTDPGITGFDRESGSDQSKSIVENLGIIHVYNKIADLEWENTSSNFIRFGERNDNKSHLTNASSMIQLIAESGLGRVSSEKISEIRAVIAEAEKIYFLGFGFDQDNMSILFGSNINNDNFSESLSCKATAINLPQTVKDQYPFITFYDMKCSEMIKSLQF